jgi:hypothetical protein
VARTSYAVKGESSTDENESEEEHEAFDQLAVVNVGWMVTCGLLANGDSLVQHFPARARRDVSATAAETIERLKHGIAS